MNDLASHYFAWVALCSAGLVCTLAGEWRSRAIVTLLGKAVAASAYLGAAVATGALESSWGTILIGGMVLCWAGDLLLVSRANSQLFMAGLIAFLLGHLVYCVAFAIRGQSLIGGMLALVLMAVFAAWVFRWLGPHLKSRMRGPVFAYVVAISLMWALAAGSFAALGGVSLLVGASLFVLSDLAVARQRFVRPAFPNRAWGLPAYFAAQLLLALAAAR